jgi:hypothetical protein
VFESGIIKIVSRKADTLTVQETSECACFKNHVEHGVREEVVECIELTYDEKVLRSTRHCVVVSIQNNYEDLNFIIPTSNIVKRLFSSCAMGLTDYRRFLLPIHFEEVMYFIFNRQFWDAFLVS